MDHFRFVKLLNKFLTESDINLDIIGKNRGVM